MSAGDWLQCMSKNLFNKSILKIICVVLDTSCHVVMCSGDQFSDWAYKTRHNVLSLGRH